MTRREELEVEFLRRLMQRDDQIWRERMAARDRIVSNSQVTAPKLVEELVAA